MTTRAMVSFIGFACIMSIGCNASYREVPAAKVKAIMEEKLNLQLPDRMEGARAAMRAPRGSYDLLLRFETDEAGLMALLTSWKPLKANDPGKLYSISQVTEEDRKLQREIDQQNGAARFPWWDPLQTRSAQEAEMKPDVDNYYDLAGVDIFIDRGGDGTVTVYLYALYEPHFASNRKPAQPLKHRIPSSESQLKP